MHQGGECDEKTAECCTSVGTADGHDGVACQRGWPGLRCHVILQLPGLGVPGLGKGGRVDKGSLKLYLLEDSAELRGLYLLLDDHQRSGLLARIGDIQRGWSEGNCRLLRLAARTRRGVSKRLRLEPDLSWSLLVVLLSLGRGSGTTVLVGSRISCSDFR